MKVVLQGYLLYPWISYSEISSFYLIKNSPVPSLSCYLADKNARQWIWASSPIPLSSWMFTSFIYDQTGYTALYGGGVNTHEIWLIQRPALENKTRYLNKRYDAAWCPEE